MHDFQFASTALSYNSLILIDHCRAADCGQATSRLLLASRIFSSYCDPLTLIGLTNSAERQLVQNSKTRHLPEAFGFREGMTSVHMSRTMMLGELSLLLA